MLPGKTFGKRNGKIRFLEHGIAIRDFWKREVPPEMLVSEILVTNKGAS